MLFQVHHSSTYRYSEPVFLEPHCLRFQPRSDGTQSVEAFQLLVTPEPVGRTDQLDADGNSISFVWFDGVHDQLHVSSSTRVQTLRKNPYDFLLPPKNHQLSQPYSDHELMALQPALARLAIPSAQDSVRSFALELAAQADGQIFGFLQRLNQTLHEQVDLCHRELGDPYSPEQTLSLGRGACRDLAVLFADACRSVGLAARFTSGYHLGSDHEDEHDLHAWDRGLSPQCRLARLRSLIGTSCGRLPYPRGCLGPSLRQCTDCWFVSQQHRHAFTTDTSTGFGTGIGIKVKKVSGLFFSSTKMSPDTFLPLKSVRRRHAHAFGGRPVR